jgi:hypothetical protein
MGKGPPKQPHKPPAAPASPAASAAVGDPEADRTRLADENRRLLAEVARLKGEKEDLEKRREELNRDLAARQTEIKEARATKGKAESEASDARAAQKKAETDAESARREGERAKAEYTAKLRDLTENVETWVQVEREKRLAAAAQEAARTREAAAKEADGTRATAQRETEDLRAEAEKLRAEAAKERDEARRAADRLRETARTEELNIKDEAAKWAAEERRKAAAEAVKVREVGEQTASRIRGDAEELAFKVKREAEQGAARLEAKARDVLARAEAEAATATETREAELEEREAELDERAVQLQEEAADLLRREKAIEARTRQLDAIESDLEQERRRLERDRQALTADLHRLGPKAVEALERKVAELTQRLEVAQEAHLDAAAHRDELQAALDEVGATDAGMRQEELNRLRNQVDTLQTRLSQSLPLDEVEALRAELAHTQAYKDQAADLRQKLHDLEPAQQQAENFVREARRETARVEAEKRRLESELAQAEGDREEFRLQVTQMEIAANYLKSLQIQLEAERIQREAMERKLAEFTKAAEKAGSARFGMLSQIDQESVPAPVLAPSPPLDRLANTIQQAIAGDPDKPLYYDLHTIRAFLGSLASADLTLLQGPSGTGKTSLPMAVGRAIGAEVQRIPVQAGWRDRADLVGDYNAFSERFRSTPFTEALYRARLPAFQDRPVFVVLDECNLSQMEYYFADLLSELEDWSQDLKHIRLFDEKAPPNMKAPAHLKDGTHLPLARNVRYFGTANQDETTFGIADKTYDRAAVIMLEERAKRFPPKVASPSALSWSSMKGRFDAAINQPGYDRESIHKFVNALESLYMREFGFGLGNRFEERIIGQFLPVYVAASGKVTDGLDHLVRTRIVRRLERSRDPAWKEPLHQLDALLSREWPFKGEDPTASRIALEKVIKRVGG